MTYAGLTISDKPALEDAKARGAEWVARDLDFEKSLNGFSEKPKRIDWTWTLCKGFFDKRKNIPLDESKLKFVTWYDDEPVSIDLALAQIEEMEKAEKPQEEMTIHGYSIRHLELIAILMRDHGVTPEDVKEAARNYSSGAMFAFTAANEQIQKGFKDAVNRIGSPYTEGEKK